MSHPGGAGARSAVTPQCARARRFRASKLALVALVLLATSLVAVPSAAFADDPNGGAPPFGTLPKSAGGDKISNTQSCNEVSTQVSQQEIKQDAQGVQNGTGDVSDAIAKIFVRYSGEGAGKATCSVVAALTNSTSPVLTSPTSWFRDMWQMMSAVFVLVVVPMLLISTIHAVAKGSLEQLTKTFVLYLPLAFLGMVIGINLVQLLINIVDDLSGVFLSSMGQNVAEYTGYTAAAFKYTGKGGVLPFLLLIVINLFMIVACVALWIILTMREASVYIATAFMPICFALFVWPSTANFLRRIVEFLVGMILSKLLMVAGLALMVSALTVSAAGANSADTVPDGQTSIQANTATAIANGSGSGNGDGDLTRMLGALVMFITLCTGPAVAQRLLHSGVGEMGQHMGSFAKIPSFQMPIIYGFRLFGPGSGLVPNLYNTFANSVPAGVPFSRRRQRQNAFNNQTVAQNVMANLGIDAEKDGSAPITDEQLQAAGLGAKARSTAEQQRWDDFDVQGASYMYRNYEMNRAERQALAGEIQRLSNSTSLNDVALAHTLLSTYAQGGGQARVTFKDGSRTDGFSQVMVNDINKGPVNTVLLNVQKGTQIVRFQDKTLVNNAVRAGKANNPYGAPAEVKVLVPVLQDSDRKDRNYEPINRVIRSANSRRGPRVSVDENPNRYIPPKVR